MTSNIFDRFDEPLSVTKRAVVHRCSSDLVFAQPGNPVNHVGPVDMRTMLMTLQSLDLTRKVHHRI